jgi:hypothetical protein
MPPRTQLPKFLSGLWLALFLPTVGIGFLGWMFHASLDRQDSAKAQPSSPNTAIAREADRFVDTIGVTIHLYYIDTVYNNFDDILKPRLTELGIRHVRDGAITSGDFYPLYYQRCKALAQSGIRFNLAMLNQAKGKRWQPITDFSKLNTIYQACGKGVASFEGSNEPDLFGPRNGAPDWIMPNREGQRQLYAAVKGNATLAKLPVISPSVTSLEAAIALGNLSNYLDNGNMHNYFAGRNPETEGWGGPFQFGSVKPGQSGCREISPQQYRATEPSMALYGSVAFNRLCNANPISGGKPIIVTETGWDNAVNQKSPGSVPESVSAVYVPRLFLHHWNQGIVRTYIYEFLDLKPNPGKTDPELNFGLVRNNGTPKPAFQALKNLIQTLKDPGRSFQPKSLNYQLGGRLANVQKTLMQKRNGDFYLALWLGVPIWEANERKLLTVPAQAVTVTLNDPQIRNVTRLDWQTNGSITTNRQSLTRISDRTSQIKLQVSPQLTILHLSRQ